MSKGDNTRRWGRREFMGAMGVIFGHLGLGAVGLGCDREPRLPGGDESADAPPLPDDVFKLGVASGDPLHDRVMIWTRLAPEPLGDGGMPDVDVPVFWEVFEDEGLSRPVTKGWAWAVPELAHSVHVDVEGLEPSRTYWYRFRAGDEQYSSVGRTRTFPAPYSSPERLRIALACCQRYGDGYFTAHDHLAAMD
ncbi:MAG: alkaline phosphatase D family protein, partial [Bradymonadaceae bacterium]